MRRIKNLIAYKPEVFMRRAIVDKRELRQSTGN